MPAPHQRGHGRPAARWPLVACAAALVFALWVLVDLGSGALGVPLTSVDALVTWVDHSSPDTMALALLRLAALAGASYLAACTLLLLAVAMVRRPGMASGALRLTPAIVRRLAFGGGGIGVAAGTLLAVSPSPVAAAPVVPVTASVPGDDEPVSATTATMTRIDTPSGDDARGVVVADADDTTSASATATMTRSRPAVGEVAAVPAAPAPAPRAARPGWSSPATRSGRSPRRYCPVRTAGSRPTETSTAIGATSSAPTANVASTGTTPTCWCRARSWFFPVRAKEPSG